MRSGDKRMRMEASYILFLILFGTLILFIWGRWRYDMVSALGLLTAVIFGIVPFQKAFSGFSNAAVMTVGFVMIITTAISRTGILSYWVSRLKPLLKHPISYTAILSIVTAFLSAFMNNVGALALMMPIAIESSIKVKRSPSLILIPCAIASVLGGMTTAIGTPPNIFISEYRHEVTGHAFSMFDYSMTGLPIVTLGILFIATIGWCLLPARRKAALKTEELFQIEDYMTEVKIPNKSPAVGKSIKELEEMAEGDILVIGFIRGKKKRLMTRSSKTLEANDILLIEASHHDLNDFIHSNQLKLMSEKAKMTSDILRSEDTALLECVIPPGSRMERRSSQGLRLRSRYKINLLAISRGGEALKQRLQHVLLRAGDVVLFQGSAETLQATLVKFGCLPLTERGVQVGQQKRGWLPLLIFVLAIVLTAFGIFPVQIAFAVTVLCYILFKIIPIRIIYESVDWPIIVLLAMMIPLGQALENTGGTALIAHVFLSLGSHLSATMLLALLMLVTMTLSDLMNNSATAVLMAPIAVALAHGLHAHVDPFLMSVAIGSSCSFLTPISHQNNMLVMGPGGYKFYDYLRLGIPIELLVLLVGIPMILYVWPLH